MGRVLIGAVDAAPAWEVGHVGRPASRAADGRSGVRGAR
jgi:hypothetical protein